MAARRSDLQDGWLSLESFILTIISNLQTQGIVKTFHKLVSLAYSTSVRAVRFGHCVLCISDIVRLLFLHRSNHEVALFWSFPLPFALHFCLEVSNWTQDLCLQRAEIRLCESIRRETDALSQTGNTHFIMHFILYFFLLPLWMNYWQNWIWCCIYDSTYDLFSVCPCVCPGPDSLWYQPPTARGGSRRSSHWKVAVCAQQVNIRWKLWLQFKLSAWKSCQLSFSP